ncbi:ABC transporter permease [Actinokineospora inagensis]|uniref:ABC transporter permease n=1 Tax=Actinokineospora inagensis TaxID=103730 RepID=UPI00041F42B9|nr:ABC transporter permease [Actinokineospora inagensis]
MTASTEYLISSAGSGEVTLARTIKSEWVKFGTLWSNRLLAATAVLGMVGIGWVASFFTNHDWDHLRPRQIARFDAVDTSLNGWNLAQLAIGVLGVILVTGEYGTGMIRATLTAVPTRRPVLWAKLVVLTVVAAVLMTATSFTAFLGGQLFLGSHSTTLGAPNVLRVVIATGLYLTLVAVLGLAFGTLLRNTAAGIACFIGILLVLPAITDVLPSSWQDTVVKYLPSNAGQAALTVKADPALLAPWTGMAVFACYVVAALVCAAVTLTRRDA